MSMFDQIQQFDSSLIIGIQQKLGADCLTSILKVITQCGSILFLTVLCVILVLCKRTRRVGMVCTASVLLATLLGNYAIKHIVERPRPWITLEEVIRFIAVPPGTSFPSGHANCSMAIAMAWTISTMELKKEDFLRWKKVHLVGAVGIITSLVIGFSRVYLGVHYPSDVLCGWMLGALCAIVVCEVYKKFLKKDGNLII